MVWRDERWWRFLVVGGVCFTANLIVLYVGTDVLGLHYLVSMLLSILIANTLGWWLNRRWSFRSRARGLVAEYLRYFAVTLTSSFLSLILMAVLVSGLRLHYLAASSAIAVGLTLFNFLAHRGWSFARQPRDLPPE